VGTEHRDQSGGLTPIARLMWPKSVAVLGASVSPTKVGGRVPSYLRRGGFGGEVIEVNPHRAGEAGVLSSIRELAEPVDVLVVALPCGQVHKALEDAERFTHNVVVLTAGYEETGPALTQAAELDLGRLRDLATQGIGVLGPNCNGYYNAHHRAVVSFAPVFEAIFGCAPGSGAVMITQSGAYGARFASACQRKGIPLDSYINTGNELGYKAGAVLEGVLETLPITQTVVLYLESLRDPEVLFRAVRSASDRGVHVLVLQGGRSKRGQQGARSHTAAITPPPKLVQDLLEYAGAVVLDSDAEVLDAVTITSTVGTLPRSPRLGVITVSGGVGVLAADRCDRHELVLPLLSTHTQAAVAAHLPDFASVTNPVDMTGHAVSDPDYQRNAAHALSASREVDVVAVCVAQAMIPGVVAGLGDDAIPVAILLDGTSEELSGLAAQKIPAFATVSGAIDAIANSRARQPETVGSFPQTVAAPPADCVNVAEAMAAVAEAGAMIPRMEVAATLEAVALAAERIGWPVTLKANCDSALHKKSLGLVRLGIGDPKTLASATSLLFAQSQTIVVQEHVSVDQEFIVGARKALDLGSTVVVIGLGGTLAEALRLTITVPSNATCTGVPQGMHDGRRLRRVVPDIDQWWPSLLAIGRALARMCEQGGYETIEANPIAIAGGRLLALDARFVKREVGVS